MNKTFSYIPDSVLRFAVNPDRHIRIRSSGNSAPVIDLKLPVSEPYARLMGRWIIECTKNTILMRETAAEADGDYIELSFQPPGAAVEAEYSGQGGRETSTFENVDRICVYPREAGWFKVQLRESAADSGETPAGAGNSPAQNAAGAAFSAEDRARLEDEIRQLKGELAREKAYTKYLQDTIEKHLDDVLLDRNLKKQALTPEIQAKQKELADLDAEIQKLEKSSEEAPKEIQAKKDELTNLQERWDELEKQREAVELDCEKARKQVEELKAHVSLDAETAALLEEGDRLKHGTVSKTLEELNGEIEKVEKRIAFILKVQTGFHQIVEDAVLTGDGTISTDEEAGGIADGNGSTAPRENT